MGAFIIKTLPGCVRAFCLAAPASSFTLIKTVGSVLIRLPGGCCWLGVMVDPPFFVFEAPEETFGVTIGADVLARACGVDEVGRGTLSAVEECPLFDPPKFCVSPLTLRSSATARKEFKSSWHTFTSPLYMNSRMAYNINTRTI